MPFSPTIQTLGNNIRASQETFETVSLIFKSSPASKLGDDGWAFLERLALAAIDIGRLDVADQCLQQLSTKFPNSPRLDVLTGIRMEATTSPTTVLQYYTELLETDSTNAAVWKRRISTIRRVGKIGEAVEELSQFLDIFYTDVEGWLELADVYSSCNQYASALEALAHALVLAPRNPFTVLQFAETAYTAGDLPLALKMFLLVIDMSEGYAEEDEPPTGINVRAWWGVKLCSRHLVLLSPSPVTSASNTPIPMHIKLLDELATERVLLAYRGRKGNGLKEVLEWMATR